jgi:hypothetical protein
MYKRIGMSFVNVLYMLLYIYPIYLNSKPFFDKILISAASIRNQKPKSAKQNPHVLEGWDSYDIFCFKLAIS